MDLLVRHRHQAELHTGICFKTEIVQAEAPSSSLDIKGNRTVVPMVICHVAWEQQITNDKGESSYPDDKERLPAVCLHYGHELIFEGPYVHDDNNNDDFTMVGEFLSNNQPEVYAKIIEAINEEGNNEPELVEPESAEA